MNKNIRPTVYKILQEDEYAREDDNYLIFKTLNELTGIDKSTAIWSTLNNMKYKGISFEAITRARRKFFEEYPELKEKKSEEARKVEEEKYYMEYAKHVPYIN